MSLEDAKPQTTSTITFSVLSYYPKNKIPDEIDLRTVTTPLNHPIPNMISGLYGMHNKLTGMMHARQYATKNKLEMVTIDVRVRTATLYTGKLPLEALDKHDAIHMQNLMRPVQDLLVDHWRHSLLAEGRPEAVLPTLYRWTRIEDFVGDRPDLIASLLEENAFKHVRTFIHPAKTPISSDMLVFASIRNTEQIESAEPRFHPHIRIIF